MSHQKTTLDQLTAALAAAEGKLPEDILRAFIPERQTLFGRQLVTLTAGHYLALANFNHPLVCRSNFWTYEDIPLAMFLFTRPSTEIFTAIADGVFEDQFYRFLETLPCEEMAYAIEQLVAHWATANAPALAMKSPHATQKKTADLDGSSPS